MTYYQIDSLARGIPRHGGAERLCRTLVAALDDLRAARMSAPDPAPRWVAVLGDATERAIERFEAHVETATHGHPTTHTTSGRTARALRALHAEHEPIRRTLAAQLAFARGAGAACPGGAVMLLDAAIDTECLIALHINGLAALVRMTRLAPSATFMKQLERAGPPRIGVEL